MSMISLYYGEIKPERMSTWNSNSNPYDILIENKEVPAKYRFEPYYAEKILFDEVKVDWGSFAYKCTKEQLAELFAKCRIDDEWLQILEDDKVYGVVWIEEY